MLFKDLLKYLSEETAWGSKNSFVTLDLVLIIQSQCHIRKLNILEESLKNVFCRVLVIVLSEEEGLSHVALQHPVLSAGTY